MTSWIDAIAASAALREAETFLFTCAYLFEECVVPCPISEWPAGADIDYGRRYYDISDARVKFIAFIAACVLSSVALLLASFVR